MVGVNVPIPVPVAYYSFGGWKASLFGDTHMYGPEGIALLHPRQGRHLALARPGHLAGRPRLPDPPAERQTRCHDPTYDGPLAGIPDRRGDGPHARPRPRLPLLVGAGADRPAADRRARRARDFWDYAGKQLPRLLQPAGQRQHRLPAPEAGRRRSRAGGPAVTTIQPSFANDARSRGGAADRRGRAGRPQPGLLHQRRRRGQRERASGWPGCTPAGTRCSRPTAATTARPPASIALTGDPRRWPNEPRHPGRRALLGALPLPLGLPRRPPRRRSASAPCSTCATRSCSRAPATDRRDHPRDRRRHQRHPGAAGRLPRRRPRALRRVRHRADRRRGDGRASAAAASGSRSTTGTSAPT